jgi:hypothetical protein
LKTLFFAILVFTLPSGAISTEGLSKALSFTRGVYKVKKGSNPACISGKFEIFDANGKVFHLKAAESIFASNIHTKKLASEDDICKIEYSTKIIKNGFVNTETMECFKPETFYRRALKVQKKGSKGMEYSLSTQNSKKSKKQNLRCRLDLIKKY